MTPQELKDALLQRAIQGKLVPQDPKEGTGEELLRQIRIEKEKLISEGKIKKEKPFKDIKDDEKPFEIPKNWVWVRLGDVITLLSGRDLIPTEYNAEQRGIPYITGASNIDKGQVIINRWTEFAKVIALRGNILLSCKGTIGKISILQEDSVHIARQIMAIIPIFADTSFVKFFLDIVRWKPKSMIPGIERKDVLNLVFPLPPLSEQKRIVAKLESLKPFVERYARAKTRLDEISRSFPDDLRRGLLQRAIEGRLVERDASEGTGADLLREIQKEKQALIASGKIKKEKPLPEIKDDEKPFEIPEHWTWARIGDCSTVYNGNSINAEEKQRKYSTLCEGFPFIATKDVGFNSVINYENGIYIPKGIASFKIAPRDSVLLCMEGGSAGKKIGYLTRDVCFGNKLCCFHPFVLNPYFLFCYLQSPSFVNNFTVSICGMIGGVGISKLRNMLLPIPPLSEQKRIVAKLEALLPLCDRLTSARRLASPNCSRNLP